MSSTNEFGHYPTQTGRRGVVGVRMLMGGVGVRYVEGRGTCTRENYPAILYLNLNILTITHMGEASIQRRAKLQHQQICDFTMTFLFRHLQCPSTRPSNDKPLKLKDFIFSNGTFILRVQESDPKLHIIFLHREFRIVSPTMLTSFTQASLSTLHILFHLIIPYFLCLHAIQYPIMIS